jgi:hypothetical protein
MSACLTWKISRAESSPHDRPGAGTAQPSLPISWSPVWREADHHFFLAGSQARSLIGIKVGKLSMFSMGGSPSNRLIPAYHQRIPPTLAMVPATAMPLQMILSLVDEDAHALRFCATSVKFVSNFRESMTPFLAPFLRMRPHVSLLVGWNGSPFLHTGPCVPSLGEEQDHTECA